MAKMTDAEAQKHAIETGTHRLMNAVIQNKPCGCTVDGAGNLPSPIRVEFCEQHKKAIPTLREVYQTHECTTPGENFCRICRIIEDAGFKFP